MARPRVEMHNLQELVRLHRMGQSARAVARQLGISPNTERRYRMILGSAGLLAGPADALPEEAELRRAVEAALPRRVGMQQKATTAAWEGEIKRLLRRGAGPKAIHDWLVLNVDDYDASYFAVKRTCRRLQAGAPVRAEDVVIPVETAPGSIAQVDFGYVGYLVDPRADKLRKAWVFVMVLGHSRHMFAKVVFDQRVSTWLRLHVEAFQFFGGVPAVVVPDNLKAAVIRAAFGLSDQPAPNRSYRDLARHFGCRIDPTPPRSPEKKGKVEAGVKYVKRNFFAANDVMDIAAVNEALERWVLEIAGRRVHGSTRLPPLATFEAVERAALSPLPQQPYDPVEHKHVKVHPDAHVSFDGRLYPVPWTLVGKRLWIRATSSSVVVWHDGERIATHERRGKGRRATRPGHLPDHRAHYRHREPDYWLQRAQRIGDHAHALVAAVFESDDVLLQLRAVQSIVGHLETFPRDRAEAACERACFYGNHTYRGVRDILRKGLDLQPLPERLPLAHGRLETASFARVPVLPQRGPGGPDEYH